MTDNRIDPEDIDPQLADALDPDLDHVPAIFKVLAAMPDEAIITFTNDTVEHVEQADGSYEVRDIPAGTQLTGTFAVSPGMFGDAHRKSEGESL